MVLAFLLSGAFWTGDVWLRWLRAAPPGAVAVAFHASNTTPAEAAAIADWAGRVARDGHPVAAVPPRPTAWAHPSLLRAQLALFDTCAAAFPAASHFLLLSEKCVPLVPPARALAFCASPAMAGRSAFNFYAPVNAAALAPLRADLTARFGVEYRAGGQFALLHAGQYAAVAATAAAIVAAYEFARDWAGAAAASNAAVPLDEWVLPSCLWSSAGPTGWHYAEVVLAHFAPCAVRASFLPPGPVGVARLAAAAARAARDCHWLAARKVAPTAEVVGVLEAAGVFNKG